MSRINFKGKNGGIFHHLTPYGKKRVTPKVIFKESSEAEFEIEQSLIMNNELLEVNSFLQHDTTRLRGFGTIRVNYGLIPNGHIAVDQHLLISKKEPSIEENIVTVVDNPTNYKHKNGFRSYHKHQTFTYQGQSLSVSDSIGGCGMQQFYGWYNTIFNEKVASILIQYYIKNRHNGVGLVICQLGQAYYDGYFERALIKNGFKVLSEFNNLMHSSSGKYKQRVYGLSLTIDSISKDVDN